MMGSAYLLHVPDTISRERSCPLVVALSPSADARGMVEFWKNLSLRHGLIVMASREYRNGINVIPVLAKLAEIIQNEIIGHYPVDLRRIIATGFSGGGMGAHAFACEHPHLISAVIVNTCMMNEGSFDEEQGYPEGKSAVFIASPADFRYREMKRDCAFLERHLWKILWLEFSGGHRMAPETIYDEALIWLLGELR